MMKFQYENQEIFWLGRIKKRDNHAKFIEINSKLYPNILKMLWNSWKPPLLNRSPFLIVFKTHNSKTILNLVSEIWKHFRRTYQHSSLDYRVILVLCETSELCVSVSVSVDGYLDSQCLCIILPSLWFKSFFQLISYSLSISVTLFYKFQSNILFCKHCTVTILF